MPGRRGWAFAAAVSGVPVAAVGIAVLASRASREAGFGWFAYAPPSDQQLDRLVAVNGARVLGALLVAAGLVLVALAAGARVAREGVRARSLRSVGVVGGLALLAGLAAQLAPQTLVVVGDEPPISTSGALLPGQVVGLAVALAGLLLVAGAVGARISSRPDGSR